MDRAGLKIGLARAQWRLFLTVALAMATVYGSLYWLSSYLARSAS
jgi:hypothetical protein